MRKAFEDFGDCNGKCVEVTSLRGIAGLVHLEPFEETFKFKDQTEKSLVVSAAVGKNGGGITKQEILTAKQKLVIFLKAAALNQRNPGDLQEDVLRKHTKVILFAKTSPALFVDPQSIILRKF